MSFVPPKSLEKELEELLTRYPQKRSASIMMLHSIQERFGHISKDAMEWVAQSLGLQPIQVLELVTFYPMFHQKPVGKFHFKICRTLSCSLAGSNKIYERLCEKLGLDPHGHGAQTTEDGRFTVEFVECLAACDQAPVLMCNSAFYEKMSIQSAENLLKDCTKEK